jgi:hypothetical protein
VIVGTLLLAISNAWDTVTNTDYLGGVGLSLDSQFM